MPMVAGSRHHPLRLLETRSDCGARSSQASARARSRRVWTNSGARVVFTAQSLERRGKFHSARRKSSRCWSAPPSSRTHHHRHRELRSRRQPDHLQTVALLDSEAPALHPLHLRHHRETERLRPHPRRCARADGEGNLSRLRPQGRRPFLLALRHRLDDGRRGPSSATTTSAARSSCTTAHPISRRRPPLANDRAPPHHDLRRLAHRDSRADATSDSQTIHDAIRCACSARRASLGTTRPIAGSSKTSDKRRCPIINISGGTEIVGCFLFPLPIQPLKPCTLGGPAPGMAVEVVDEDGIPSRGEMGYLVCTKPAPSMTRGIWGDPERYLETYWSTLARHVVSRRLGQRRRGRLLVPARPRRRIDERRRPQGRTRRSGRCAHRSTPPFPKPL